MKNPIMKLINEFYCFVDLLFLGSFDNIHTSWWEGWFHICVSWDYASIYQLKKTIFKLFLFDNRQDSKRIVSDFFWENFRLA